LEILCAFSEALSSPDLLASVRLSPTAFLRQRHLTFPKLLTLMLSGMCGSIQQELDRLAANLQGSTDLQRTVTAQAFSKARKGFSASVFRALNTTLLHLIETRLSLPRWRGFRVVAADASKLQLCLKDATGRKVREAIAFMMYLPGTEMTLDFELYAPEVSERQMLFEHLPSLKRDDLLVLDRGYPARWLVAVLLARGLQFCMRVDDTGFAEVARFRWSGDAEAVVTLAPPSAADAKDYGCPREATQVRLVRVITPTGRVHILMTSLLNAIDYPAADFGDLYHARWRIEEAFKRIKHRLALEHLTGISWLAAQQDFGAKILGDNLHALSVYCAAQDPAATPPKARKPETSNRRYQPNRAYAFAAIKSRMQRWLLAVPITLDDIERLFTELMRNLIAFVPGASKPRNMGRKPHKHMAYKACA